ncbi:MAG: NAD(P)H-dependent glycerol-3-phosphate dehydrogenase [Myxococcota bacterium]|nr:NAD(P)H-dependent glycerol-3-phosphate dehydrogenase [Myxococcota bacterium]
MKQGALRACVVGAGAWGTALASVLCEAGHQVTIWAFEPKVSHDIQANRLNSTYLPDVALPDGLQSTSKLNAAIAGADLIISVVPSQHTRRVTELWSETAKKDAVIVCASKGIELGTGKLLSDVFEETLPASMRTRMCFLSGPSFAKEVACQQPTVVVCASTNEAAAQHVQHAFARPFFRTYWTHDVVGVEVGGALKNVMAIATGICDGMGLGLNARAALITRGLFEITRVAVALGAEPTTLMGLAGQGDLILTCTGDLSRNRRVGLALGKGENLEKVLGAMPQVVEGVATAQAAHRLARRLGVSTPIIDEVYGVLHQGLDVSGTVERLMTRSLKREAL